MDNKHDEIFERQSGDTRWPPNESQGLRGNKMPRTCNVQQVAIVGPREGKQRNYDEELIKKSENAPVGKIAIRTNLRGQQKLSAQSATHPLAHRGIREKESALIPSDSKKEKKLKGGRTSVHMERAQNSITSRFKRTKHSLDSVALRPFKGMMAGFDGQNQAQMSDNASGAAPLATGFASGFASVVVAAIKLTTTIISALVSFVGFVAATISATAAVIVAVVIAVIVAVFAAVMMANPALSMEQDSMVYLKYLCDNTISQKITDDWANRYPLHQNIQYQYDGQDANVANYAEVVALAYQLSNEKEIENSVVSEIALSLNSVTYDASDPVTLMANIEKYQLTTDEYNKMHETRGKNYVPAEIQDLIASFHEALEGIQGNHYDLFAVSPLLVEQWNMPFAGEPTILKPYETITETLDQHWISLLFETPTTILSPSTGIISHINEAAGLIRVRYMSGIMLELKGSLLINPSLVTGALVSSGSTLFTVLGELSLKMTMTKDIIPIDNIVDSKTGESISVSSLIYNETLHSVDPISFIRYKQILQAGQDGLRQQIVAEALTYLGVPYQLGGASRTSIDCSGLTMVVYNKITSGTPYATKFTHGSRAQDTYGQSGAAVFDHIYVCWRRPHRSGGLTYEQRLEKMNADVSLLKPGDLLFFWNEQYIGGALNNHVGIYIGRNPVTGSPEFIHATTGGNRVMVQNMMTYAIWPGRARRPIWD